MKIARIFGNRLYAFQYEGEEDNEYDRLMDLWTDPVYLRDFLQGNLASGESVNEVIMAIRDDSESLDDAIAAAAADRNQKMETFFKPLHNEEYHVRSLSKQKARKNYLRLYAIRIDEDCFVITGGAIKLTHLMEDSPHTSKELTKLEKARSFLREQGIMDVDSFFEFEIEQADEQ